MIQGAAARWSADAPDAADDSAAVTVKIEKANEDAAEETCAIVSDGVHSSPATDGMWQSASSSTRPKKRKRLVGEKARKAAEDAMTLDGIKFVKSLSGSKEIVDLTGIRGSDSEEQAMSNSELDLYLSDGYM